METTPAAGDVLKGKLEAILFAAARTVPLAELCTLCAVSEPGLVREAAKELKAELESRGSSLVLLEEGDGWKLSVREQYVPLVQNIIPNLELDHALLETLAVIAWKQPVLQAEVVRIRTSTAYEHVKLLEEMGFVSKEKQGRSFVLKATGKFFDYFDLPGKEAVRQMFKHIEESYEKEHGARLEEQKPVDELHDDAQDGVKPAIEPGHLGQLEVVDLPEEQKRQETTEEEATEENTLSDDQSGEGSAGTGDVEEPPSDAGPKEPAVSPPPKHSLHPHLEAFAQEAPEGYDLPQQKAQDGKKTDSGKREAGTPSDADVPDEDRPKPSKPINFDDLDDNGLPDSEEKRNKKLDDLFDGEKDS